MDSAIVAIESLISSIVGAANSNNVKASAAVFAEDAEFTNVFGQAAKGRTAVEEFHAPFFRSHDNWAWNLM
jgi:uncharacterized protein (TIGR02246 family)